MSNGKGDRPRNNFSRKFRANYDRINWSGRKKTISPLKETSKFNNFIIALSEWLQDIGKWQEATKVLTVRTKEGIIELLNTEVFTREQLKYIRDLIKIHKP